MPFDGTPTTEVELTLIAARALVKKGWCKRRSEKMLKAGPSYCVTGAIRHVIHTGEISEDGSYKPHLIRLEEEVKSVFKSVLEFGNFDWNIEAWNDQKERKKAEVLAAFDRAIAKT